MNESVRLFEGSVVRWFWAGRRAVTAFALMTLAFLSRLGRDWRLLSVPGVEGR
jgi:hypothetical protein